MTAFFSALSTYAIWIYLLGVIAILFGIKMLFDARRAARTTLFTLEQEQASDRAFRAVLVMGVATLVIAGVAAINAFVAPTVPPPDTAIVEPTAVPYTPPLILPTATLRPTLTPLPATPTATPRPTQAPPTAASQPPTEPPPTAPGEPPTPEPAPTSALIYLAPTLNTPPNGDSIGSNNIRFSWGVDQFGNLALPAELPPDQFYRVVVTYTSRSQNQPVTLVVCLHENSVDRRTGLDVGETRSDALDSTYQWTVTAVRSPSRQACEAGDYSPLSPPSAPSTFRLP